MLEFQNKLEKLYAPLKGDKLRDRAWDRFTELQLPTKDSEVFRYVKLKSLYSYSFEKPTSDLFCPHVPKGVQVLPLHEALKTFGSYLQNRSKQSVEEENDPFAALNSALYTEGLFVYIPPGITVETPITFVSRGTDSDYSMPKIIASVGKGSEVKVVLETVGEGSFNQLSDWNLEEGARLKIVQMSPPSTARKQLDALRATLKRDSFLQVVNLTTGSDVTRFDYRIDLNSPGASAEIASLSDLSGKNEAHLHVLMRHLAPHCTSNQLVKNILRDFSHSSFEGKIYVDSEAQKTEAYQLNANLLLSDGARAESKPNLEIFADDVKASHGATFGQLESELLFYLQTRGLTKEAATEILIDGFANEVKCKSFLP